jgi:hypothetical protein
MMGLWYEHVINLFSMLTLNHIKVCLFYANEGFMGLVKHYMIFMFRGFCQAMLKYNV